MTRQHRSDLCAGCATVTGASICCKPLHGVAMSTSIRLVAAMQLSTLRYCVPADSVLKICSAMRRQLALVRNSVLNYHLKMPDGCRTQTGSGAIWVKTGQQGIPIMLRLVKDMLR